KVLQPAGSRVGEAGSVGREPGPVHGSGGVGAGHRCVQRGGTSLTLVGQPPSRHGSDTPCTVPSQPVASHCSRFRGETPFGASKVSASPVCTSQTRTVCSPLAEAMRLPSELKHTLWIGPVCPLKVNISFPVCASHSFPPPVSGLPLVEAMRLPSGENATLKTYPVCPLRVSASCPVCASHTFTSPNTGLPW